MGYYDDIAPGYNQLHELEQKEKLREISLIIDQKYADKFNLGAVPMLDVGCGSGISSDWWVEKYGAVVTGIDPSKALISLNKKQKSTFIVASAESLPFRDAQFEIVTSITAIQNFSDVMQGLKEMKRAGKHKFILTVLKKSQNLAQMSNAIHTVFRVKAEFTVTKDVVFLIY